MELSQGAQGIVLWSEVEECAQSAFDIWVDQPELHWAQEAWEHLNRQGLTAYHNELEKCRVAIRFLALAGIYHDWCSVAWQEAVDPVYSDWADLLHISEFRLGQLVGTGCTAINEESGERPLLRIGLKELIPGERRDVLNGLLQAYGDISCLFVSLWNSNKVAIPGGVGDGETDSSQFSVEGKESAYEIFNYDIAQKAPAYEWLDQGAEQLLDSW